MGLFRKDSTAALVKVREAFAAEATRIAELQRERAAKLIEVDDISEIEAIDRQITEAQRRVAIHHARCSALEAQRDREAAERREAVRANAIKIIEKKLAARQRLGVQLEAAIREFGRLFFELANSRIPASDWPFEAPANFGAVDIETLRREVGWLLFSVGKPNGGRTVLPSATNAGLGISGVHALGVAESIAARSREVVMLLERMPLREEAEADAPADNVPPRGLAGLATA